MDITHRNPPCKALFRCYVNSLLSLLLLLCLMVALPARVFAAPTTPSSDFTDNGDGTVTHKVTGLTWMRCALGQTWTGTTCSGNASTFNWNDALKQTTNFAEHNDWRLPNIAELQTLVERDNFTPAINTEIFPGAPNYWFWSSSSYHDVTGLAWFVNFGDGQINYDNKNGGYFAVRLVKGGQALDSLASFTPSSDFKDLGDGSVQQLKSGLIWQRCALGQSWNGSSCSGNVASFTWEQAKQQQNSLGSYTDWRLPTANELATLVDYSTANPAINRELFPGTPTSGFWSSSPYALNTDNAWIVYLSSGFVGYGQKGGATVVRLVRDRQALSSLVAVPKQASASFTEPNDSPQQALPILVNDTPVIQTLDAKDKEDWYEFYAKAGTRYSIEIPGSSVGAGINPVFQVFTQNGDALSSVIERASLGASATYQFSVQTAGLYRIKVSNKTSGSKLAAVDNAYQIHYYLTDAPQQGIIKGTILNACSQNGVINAQVSARLGGVRVDSTLSAKNGEYGLPLNPETYQLKSVVESYRDQSQEAVKVQADAIAFQSLNQQPLVDCANYPAPTHDPVLLQQKAVAVYDDVSGLLTVRDVSGAGQVHYVELQNIGQFRFQLTRYYLLNGSIHAKPAEYDFNTLIAKLPSVYAYGKLWQVQIKNDGTWVFDLSSYQEVK